eukprot:Gb_40548 [translate_table: standard]
MMTSGDTKLGWPENQRETLLFVRFQIGVNLIMLLFELEILSGRDRARRSMGGDPVTTEQTVLRVDEEVREILERVGKVVVNALEFTISEQLIAEVPGLPMEGKAISREKTNQAGQLMKFLKDDETFCCLQLGIARESLSKPWDRYEKDKGGTFTSIIRGGFLRTSGTPVSNLEPTPSSLIFKTNAIISDSEEEANSHGEEVLLEVSKKDDARNLKRKPPSQVLVANLAKCSRRSSCLQKKSVEKTKIVDYMESTEEEKEESGAGKAVDVGKSAKDLGPEISDKGPVKEPGGTHNVVEELRCHLKILNGAGGTLTSTCVCINLLALEITNYLKEVVNNLKEMSSTSTQPQSSSINKEKQ